MGETVTIACRLPNGLIMRLHHKVKVMQPVMAGGFKEVDEWHLTPGVAPVVLQGFAVAHGEVPKVPIVAGYALNHNIDKEFWEKWLEQYKDMGLVKAGLVFAMPKKDDHGKPKELELTKSGLEAIDPQNLPKGIETATRASGANTPTGWR